MKHGGAIWVQDSYPRKPSKKNPHKKVKKSGGRADLHTQKLQEIKFCRYGYEDFLVGDNLYMKKVTGSRMREARTFE